MAKPKVLKAVKKKIKFLARWEKKFRDAWVDEKDKAKKKKLEKKALEITKRLDKIQEFLDRVL